MNKPDSYLFKVGVFFILGGVIAATGGCIGMMRFFDGAVEAEDFSLGQLARGLVLPHILTLLGIGVGVYGIILVARGIIFRVRLSRYNRHEMP